MNNTLENYVLTVLVPHVESLELGDKSNDYNGALDELKYNCGQLLESEHYYYMWTYYSDYITDLSCINSDDYTGIDAVAYLSAFAEGGNTAQDAQETLINNVMYHVIFGIERAKE